MSSTVEDEVAGVARAWDRAMITNDADAIGQYMADDWTIVGPDGSVGDRAGFLALVRSGDLTHDVMESRDLLVRPYGDTAVVTGRGISGGRYRGRAVPPGGAGVLRLRPAAGPLVLRPDPPLANRRRVVLPALLHWLGPALAPHVQRLQIGRPQAPQAAIRPGVAPMRVNRVRQHLHFLDPDGMVACNPRDREAAHRAEVEHIATRDVRAVTCPKCRTTIRPDRARLRPQASQP